MITHVIGRVLIFRADKKLLLLYRSRTDNYRPGGLDFPGGKVGDDETWLDGAIRETREESGIALTADQLQVVYTNCRAGYNSDYKTDINLIRLIFVAQVNEPRVTLSDEHYDFTWLSIEDALAQLNYPSGEAVLRHLLDNKIAADLWS